VAAIGREQLLPLMSAEPQIALALLKVLSLRLTELTEARSASN
jgi:CRP-like cAMP-binding protein